MFIQYSTSISKLRIEMDVTCEVAWNKKIVKLRKKTNYFLLIKSLSCLNNAAVDGIPLSNRLIRMVWMKIPEKNFHWQA